MLVVRAEEEKAMKQFTQVICVAWLLAGCTSGGSVGIGGIGIGGGGGNSGVGVGLSFPVGGSSSTVDSGQVDCDGDVYRVQPRYPEQAAAQKYSGRVTVSFNVKLNGRAADYEAAGDKPFFDETKRAVMRSCWPAGVHQNLVVSYQNGTTATWIENSLTAKP